MTRDTLVVADLTDPAKSYASKTDDVCIVRDGSRHRLTAGYRAVVVFATVRPHDLRPLRVHPYSTTAAGFESEPRTICSVLRQVKARTPPGCTGVALGDRGFDGDGYFLFLVQEAWRGIVLKSRLAVRHARRMQAALVERPLRRKGF